MDKYYHFTTNNAFDSIMEKGLIPQTGPRCQSIGDDSYGVFFSKGIKNAIIMYAEMFCYYERLMGPEGDKVIEEKNEEIRILTEQGKRRYFKIMAENGIASCNKAKDKVYQIRSYSDFRQYLGGEGFYITATNLAGIADNYPTNCCHVRQVPPTDINVLCLYSKATGEYIYNRELVLSYFMSLNPMEEVIKNIGPEDVTMVKRLYQYMNQYYLPFFEPSFYILYEIPLTSYQKPKVKTLN